MTHPLVRAWGLGLGWLGIYKGIILITVSPIFGHLLLHVPRLCGVFAGYPPSKRIAATGFVVDVGGYPAPHSPTQARMEGYCAATRFGANKCLRGSSGAWPLRETTDLKAAAEECLRRCAGCAQCRYVSVAMALTLTLARTLTLTLALPPYEDRLPFYNSMECAKVIALANGVDASRWHTIEA